ncbi:MAG: sigma factor-like helix-turn-helix DNA-binding protein [Nitrospinales bacterium]
MAQKLTSRQLKTAERRAKSFDLRLKGYSFREIAREVGISVAAAHKTIQKGLAQLQIVETTYLY